MKGGLKTLVPVDLVVHIRLGIRKLESALSKPFSNTLFIFCAAAPMLRLRGW